MTPSNNFPVFSLLLETVVLVLVIHNPFIFSKTQPVDIYDNHFIPRLPASWRFVPSWFLAETFLSSTLGFFWREGDTSSFFIARNRFSGYNIWHFMHAEMTRENLLSRIPTSNHCQPLSAFSEVHPFTARMVQKTFEINRKHAAISVLFPPSCSFLV